jgi:hypothetical protein
MGLDRNSVNTAKESVLEEIADMKVSFLAMKNHLQKKVLVMLVFRTYYKELFSTENSLRNLIVVRRNALIFQQISFSSTSKKMIAIYNKSIISCGLGTQYSLTQ